jgi:hypothetical protein
MDDQYITIAVAGLHLLGEPLNHQLTEKGAKFLSAEFTAPAYKMFLIKGGKLEKPGLARVPKAASGFAFPVELWKLPRMVLADFMEQIPHPLGIGSIELENNTWVQGFICEPCVIADCIEISEFGSWRDYVAQRAG